MLAAYCGRCLGEIEFFGEVVGLEDVAQSVKQTGAAVRSSDSAARDNDRILLNVGDGVVHSFAQGSPAVVLVTEVRPVRSMAHAQRAYDIVLIHSDPNIGAWHIVLVNVPPTRVVRISSVATLEHEGRVAQATRCIDESGGGRVEDIHRPGHGVPFHTAVTVTHAPKDTNRGVREGCYSALRLEKARCRPGQRSVSASSVSGPSWVEELGRAERLADRLRDLCRRNPSRRS